jgi:GTP-binding protein
MNVVSAKFQTSAPDLASCPVSELREFAFIGRSNVGKSSLLNMLAGAKALAKVSATPGHTQLINFFSINGAWTLVDLPGYGYARTAGKARDRFEQMIAGYLTGRANLAGVFVLIDSRHPPQQIDLEFVQWLIGESVPFALVFSKADLVKAGLLEKNTELFLEKIAAWCGELPRVFTTSSETRAGRRELLAFIGEALAGVGAFA